MQKLTPLLITVGSPKAISMRVNVGPNDAQQISFRLIARRSHLYSMEPRRRGNQGLRLSHRCLEGLSFACPDLEDGMLNNHASITS